MASKDAANRVLIIDDDADLADLVFAVLSDEGYVVSILADTSRESILAAVGKKEPDGILLDAGTSVDYGSGWTDAAYLDERR